MGVRFPLSAPVFGSSSGLGLRPFTAATGVRFPYRMPNFRKGYMKKLLIAVLATLVSYPSYAFLDTRELTIQEHDKVFHTSTENKAVRGKPNFYEAYWTINGEIENSKVFMRKVKLTIDCEPVNWPDQIMVSVSTLALGTVRGEMIKIHWIPPGAEDWVNWKDVSFIKESEIAKICGGLK